ncbi:hypothetical protein ASQ66_gp47 [Aeropyrum pernix spindle-shaped virus 1]|uniref:Uncharacterized protein n=1 Tax=Aeropyrum pernix (strain ATCC 700893 / DSM 11879 / JCM 9820 / NBRC 100138 / K1) TaxID=272557 RepID=Q9YDN1_AERPE|nr:hypothetical protein [Aeropyrum pernix]YP_009177777.1 hypothetical protein ASQ66_gp47 [Aeropyrum pernix spindle-shaped virus 1]BAA79866.1 hypothetical protein APE_0883 [Aeropyrum pernix spindle-shaped virus 1] [Aeropyrum pernix K1]CCD22135.1 TPA: hypothetical protein [Aeropyrum pernix spindle-shaped virus 1]
MGLGEVAAEVERLLGRVEEVRLEVLRLLNALPYSNCTLDYRWVRNSSGAKYWYWYAVCIVDGRRRHVYLGKAPGERVSEIEKAGRARRLIVLHRRLLKARRRLKAAADRAERVLDAALRDAREALEEAEQALARLKEETARV